MNRDASPALCAGKLSGGSWGSAGQRTPQRGVPTVGPTQVVARREPGQERPGGTAGRGGDPAGRGKIVRQILAGGFLPKAATAGRLRRNQKKLEVHDFDVPEA